MMISYALIMQKKFAEKNKKRADEMNKEIQELQGKIKEREKELSRINEAIRDSKESFYKETISKLEKSNETQKSGENK